MNLHYEKYCLNLENTRDTSAAVLYDPIYSGAQSEKVLAHEPLNYGTYRDK